MKIDLKKLIPSIALPLAVGGLSALISMSNTERFNGLNLPPLAPPSWLFPVVWTILFIIMGIAAYLVTINSTKKERETAIKVYGLQLIFNFFWSIIFFNMAAYLFAFIWLFILWVLIIINAVLFYKIYKPSGILLIPYILWVTFAGYLNLAIYFLN